MRKKGKIYTAEELREKNRGYERKRKRTRATGGSGNQGRTAGRNERVGGNNPRVVDVAPAVAEETAEDIRPPLYDGYRTVWEYKKKHGVDPCTDYARRVVEGDEVAGPLVRAACQRHLDDLRRSMTRTGRLRRGSRLYWDLDRYEHFRNFSGRLRLWQAQFFGEPVVLHPMQEFIAGSLFGWRLWREGSPKTRPAKWARRFRRAYLEIGKGNSKTPTMAIIGLYGLAADGERGAEVYIGAAKRDQAQICMTDAAEISRVSAWQGLRYTGVSPTYQVTHMETRSVMKLLSRDSGKTESGLKPHIALLDEVHEHRDGLLVSMMTRGFKFRREPMLLMATNSGFSDEVSVAREEHDAAKKLLSGEYTDDESFAYVCALDAGDEPFENEGCWRKANPMLGISQSVETLRGAVRDAKTRPSQASDVRRLHFCQWAGSISGDWMLAERWSTFEVDATIESLRGVECILGVDLSESGDMTALAWVGPTGWSDDGKPILTSVVRTYLPETGLRERGHADRMDYIRYREEGHLRTTAGGTVEYEQVADDLMADIEIVKPVAVVYDGWRFKRFEESVRAAGFPDVPMVDHPQNFAPRKGGVLRMSGSIGHLERCCMSRRFRVQANPIIRRAVSSVKLRSSDTGQSRFSKSHSTSRIDALIALTMPIGAWEYVAQGGPQAIVPVESMSKSAMLSKLYG